MIVRPTVVALLANGLLVVGIVVSWLQADRVWTPPAPLRPDPATLAVASLQSAAPVGTAAVRSALERPLFAVTRRPAEVVSQVGDNAPVETRGPAELRPIGLIGSAGGGVLLLRREGRVRRVVVGNQIDGWTLTAIEERRARLVRGDEVRELILQRAGSADNQAAPSVAAAATAPSAAAADPQAAAAGSMAARIAERRARREVLLEGMRAQ